jgi:hypothetical protein
MGQITDIKEGTRGCSFNDRFNFEAVVAQTSQDFSGFPCGEINNQTYYKIKSASGSENYSASDVNVICLNFNSSLNYSENQSYSFIIDEFGFIAIGLNALIQMNFNEAGTEGCEEPVTDLTNNGSYFYQSIAKKNACEEDQVTTYGQLGNIPGSLYCTPSNDPLVPGCNENCQAFDGCERNGSNYFSSCYAEFQGTSASSNLSQSVNSQVISSLDWDFFFNLTKQSTTKKLEVLKNNDTQALIINGNCSYFTCGSGGQEDCWSSWDGTVIADIGKGAGATSATSQKWETRVRKTNLEDEELQKYIVTVESKYYLQIPVPASDPIRILVDSGTDTFSGNQNRGSIHEFTNEDFQAQIGQPVYGCLNISRIQRL